MPLPPKRSASNGPSRVILQKSEMKIVWNLIEDLAWATTSFKATPKPPSLFRSRTPRPGPVLSKPFPIMREIEKALSKFRLGKDQDFLWAAVESCPVIVVLRGVEASLKVILKALSIDGLLLKVVPKQYQAHRQCVLAAVSQNGMALQHAHRKFKADREIVFKAVCRHGAAFAFSLLKDDRGIALSAIATFPGSLEMCSFRDKDFLVQAARLNGLVLKYVPKQYNQDWDLIFTAVSQNGMALKHVQPPLSMNPIVQEAAVRQNGLALQHVFTYVQPSQPAEDYVGLSALNQNGLALQYAHQIHRESRESVLLAVKSNGMAVAFAPARLWLERELALAAVENSYHALWFLATRARIDTEIVLTALLGVLKRQQDDFYSCRQRPALYGRNIYGQDDDYGPLNWYQLIREELVADWKAVLSRSAFCMGLLLKFNGTNELSKAVKRKVLTFLGPLSCSQQYRVAYQAKLLQIHSMQVLSKSLEALLQASELKEQQARY